MRFTNFSQSLKSIRSIIQLKDGSVIVSGYRGFTRLYPDFSMEDLNSGIYEEASGLSLSVFSLIEDIREPNKVLWAGSEGGGLYKFTINNKKIEMIKGDYTKGDFFRGEFVTSLFWGSDSMLYIGTERGLHILNTTTMFLKFFPPTIGGDSLVSFGIIYDLDEHNNTIYLSTERNGIVKFDPRSGDYSSFLSTGVSPASLPTNDIRALYFKNDDTCYVATNSGFCVFDRRSNKLRTYTMQDGLPNDLIYSILEDDSGKLWLSTNLGVACFNPKTGRFINYTKTEGLPGNEFNSKSYLKLKNGDMIFGGVEGFCVFNPAAITSDNLKTPIQLSLTSVFSRRKFLLVNLGIKLYSIQLSILKKSYILIMTKITLDWSLPHLTLM
ncbi:MAG: PQQ-like beta-propeller repeat protein [Ignavibacteriales bacterium]|nr:PQQ-like beta-propeller repeat protein [Ignavibacteriales bacterium]